MGISLHLGSDSPARNINRSFPPLIARKSRFCPKPRHLRHPEIAQYGIDIGVWETQIVTLALGGAIGKDQSRDVTVVEVEILARNDRPV
jgi:hypothetical protein